MNQYLTSKGNTPYIIFLILGILLGSYIYDFNSTIVATIIILVCTFFIGLVIKFLKH